MKRLAALLAILLIATPVLAAEQDAIDGCIDQLRAVGGPDAANGGEILSSEYSEAGTLVMLKDAGGTVWRCIGYNNGTVGELAVAQAADDGGGAMAGAPSEGTTSTDTVRFAPGSSSAEINGGLTPGSSARYVLGAKNGQFLDVDIRAFGEGITYQIFNPDNSFLLDQISSDQPYRGQLWQDGNHVVEVINTGSANTSYAIRFAIE